MYPKALKELSHAIIVPDPIQQRAALQNPYLQQHDAPEMPRPNRDDI